MRISVSQLAWDAREDKDAQVLLIRQGVTGVELTPAKIWPGWAGMTPNSAYAYARALRDKGLHIPAFQAILYGVEGAHIFADEAARRRLADHVKRVAEIAGVMGAKALVFGAPKLRDKGGFSDAEATDVAAQFFATLGDFCHDHGTAFCIEPVPASYGCNFVTTIAQGAALVRQAGSPGFRLHLDTAQMHLEGEDLSVLDTVSDIAVHLHASEPNIGGFDDPVVDHPAIADALKTAGYKGYVSIEMLRGEPVMTRIETAARYVSGVYGGLWTEGASA